MAAYHQWLVLLATCAYLLGTVSAQDQARIVIHPAQVASVDAGSSLTVACVAHGDPVPTITWSRGSSELANSSVITIYQEVLNISAVAFVKSILEICSVDEDDAGQYSCSAETSASNDTANFELSVTSVAAPAQIVMHPNNVTEVDSGDTITVGCVAYGDPLPYHSWRKDGVELANGSQIQIYEERVTESGLTFIKSILEICSTSVADIGQYSCSANNTLGFETAEFELQVNTEIADCSTLSDPPNGRVSYSGNEITAANYTCDSGYVLHGSGTRVCQANGTWSGSAPTCERSLTVVICGTLHSPSNGGVTQTGITIGESATYSCDTGFTLIGDVTRMCQATGVWSGNAPTCQCVDCTCGTLSDPVNGQVSHPSGTTFGQTATYTCDEGYILMGDITRMCQATRMWSGSEPSCQSVSSSSPDAGGGVPVWASSAAVAGGVIIVTIAVMTTIICVCVIKRKKDSVPPIQMAYNEAYDTIRGTAHEMNVLGTSSFTIANRDTLQKDDYERMDIIPSMDPPPPYNQVVRLN